MTSIIGHNLPRIFLCVALLNIDEMIRKALLFCGILSSLWYVAINIYVPLHYDHYSLATFTVSELSAIGAPTRTLWVMLVLVYPILFTAFGWGVLQTAAGIRPLRILGILVIAYCIFNVYWPPMHMRGNPPTLTDTLHIVWASVTVLLMMTMMVFGALASEIRFRIYTILSIALQMVFGFLTALEAPNIPTNGATPFIGIYERINIGIFMLWIVTLALVLLQRESVSKNLSYKREPSAVGV